MLKAFLVALISLPVIALMITLQTSPHLTVNPQLSPQDVARVQQLILDSAPQRPGSSSLQELQLSNEELNLLLQYGVELLQPSPLLAAQASLQNRQLLTDFSVKLDNPILPLYLNLTADFQAEQKSLSLANLNIGRLHIPEPILQTVSEQIRNRYLATNSSYQDITDLLDNVEQVSVSLGQVDLHLRWEPTLVSRISSRAQQIFIGKEDQQRIINHYQTLHSIAAQIPEDRRAVSLNEFLVPMFAAAADRSRDQGDPVAENRTLFLTLAAYVNQEEITQLLGSELAAQLSPARLIEVRLHRRHDLAQHLMSIAAIRISAGANVAEMLSTTKEAYDARYRSGFSFSDLSANIAGVALVNLATRDAATARLMQARLSQVVNEEDYLPLLGNNLDGLSEEDFSELYTDQTSDDYQQRINGIEELVFSSPVFQGLDNF